MKSTIFEPSRTAGRAYSAVRRAIKKGILPSLSENHIKCVLCPNRAVSYDHRDYNKPLEVSPVCQGCNKKLGSAIESIHRPKQMDKFFMKTSIDIEESIISIYENIKYFPLPSFQKGRI